MTLNIETRKIKGFIENIRVQKLFTCLKPGQSETFITDWPDYLYKTRKRLDLQNRIHIMPVRSNMFTVTRVW